MEVRVFYFYCRDHGACPEGRESDSGQRMFSGAQQQMVFRCGDLPKRVDEGDGEHLYPGKRHLYQHQKAAGGFRAPGGNGR